MKKQWISVKDALPKESMEVIVHIDFEESVYDGHAFFSKEHQMFATVDRRPEFWWNDGPGIATAYDDDVVTHWMPLPSFSQEEPGIKIKPLEWVDEPPEGFIAFGSFGTFEVMRSGNRLLPWMGSLNDSNGYDGYEEMNFPTVEEAKAYCQELHEKMIREALEFVEVAI